MSEHTETPVETLTLGAVAAALGAQLVPAEAAETRVRGVSAIGSATGETLVFASDGVALQQALQSNAAAVLTSERCVSGTEGVPSMVPMLLTPNPKLAFARAAKLLAPQAPVQGVHAQACVAPTARLAPTVSIGPFAVIGDHAELGDGVHVDAGAVVGAGCVVGAGSHVYPRAVLYPGVVLGVRVVVHAGAVLGSDGFGYVPDAQTGAYLQFPQQGRLIVEDDVEIGANTTIDRGALEETRIARGVKIDNLVHVGHNVLVGEDVVIAAQTGISGSSTIGKSAVVAGQVGIADHVLIGEQAILGAQCGVPSHKHIHGPGVLFWGTPAKPITQHLKELAALARLTRKRSRTD